MIPLGEAVPAPQKLRALFSDDLPAAYVRPISGLPEDAPVSSRVNQLAEHNCLERSPR